MQSFKCCRTTIELSYQREVSYFDSRLEGLEDEQNLISVIQVYKSMALATHDAR